MFQLPISDKSTQPIIIICTQYLKTKINLNIEQRKTLEAY